MQFETFMKRQTSKVHTTICFIPNYNTTSKASFKQFDSLLIILYYNSLDNLHKLKLNNQNHLHFTVFVNGCIIVWYKTYGGVDFWCLLWQFCHQQPLKKSSHRKEYTIYEDKQNKTHNTTQKNYLYKLFPWRCIKLSLLL
jgi:hypothetical protein